MKTSLNKLTFISLALSAVAVIAACTAQVSGSIDGNPSPSPTPSSGISVDIGG